MSKEMNVVPSTPELDWLAFEMKVSNYKYAKLRAAGKIKNLRIAQPGEVVAEVTELKNPVWALSDCFGR